MVTLLTCEAEYVAISSCLCHAIWLRKLLSEVQEPQQEATEIYMDSKSAIQLAKNPVFHDRSKHIDTKYHFIKDCVKNKEVQLVHTRSEDQISDIFTIPLKSAAFYKLRNLLGVTVIGESSLRGGCWKINLI